MTGGNSLAGYLLPENVMVLSKAVQRYGGYPLPSESTQFRLSNGFPAEAEGRHRG